MIKFVNTLKKEALEGKKVLLRVDLNVPVKDGKITNDFKIKAHQETIDYLLESGAKILLVSHHDNLESFLPIVEEIGAKIGQTISLVPHSQINFISTLFGASSILLLDNIRQDPREKKNDEELAREVACPEGIEGSKGFDLFVNDAFAVSHRNHAMVTSITKFLPSYAGFLIKKETENLSGAIESKAGGKVLVLGGAKISTKLPVIQNFLDKAEKILLGGALANDFWQMQGIKTGASLVDDSVKLNVESDKLTLPRDILISKGWTREKIKETIADGSWFNSKFQGEAAKLRNLEADEAILDIGPQSVQEFAETIKSAELVIWNGPFGFLQVGEWPSGTSVIAKAVAEAKKSVVGGGDTITAADKLGLLGKFTYVSTGGGAMLEFLAGNRLPGLEALGYYH